MNLRDRHVAKCQRHRAFVPCQNVLESRFHLAAIGTLKIRELHNHHASFGITANPRGVEGNLYARRTQQHGDLSLLAKMCGIFLARQLNLRSLEILQELRFHLFEWPV